MDCSKCGSKVDAEKTFCVVCGNKISGEVANNRSTTIVEKMLKSILEIKQIAVSFYSFLTNDVSEYEKTGAYTASDPAIEELYLKIRELISCLQSIIKSAEISSRFFEDNEELSSALSYVDSMAEDLQKCDTTASYIEKVLHICEIGNSSEAFVEKISFRFREMNRNILRTGKDFICARNSFIAFLSEEVRQFVASAPVMPATAVAMSPVNHQENDGIKVGVKGAEKRSFLSIFKRRKGPKPESLSLPENLFPPFDVGDSGEAAPPRISGVSFSGVVKKAVKREEYIPVDIIMYEQEFRNVVDAMLDDLHKEKGGGFFEVAHLTKVKVQLSSPDIEMSDFTEERTWYGNYLEFSFAVPVPEAYAKKQILIVAEVFFNEIKATNLRMIVDVEDEAYQYIEPEREDITSAFVSYASKDRKRVAAIVQGMQKARPDMDVFFDVESLRSGQKWECALKTEIDGRSIFYLCWSEAASKSKWVDFEWRYALERKGEKMIEPIPIDPPELCPPPPELSQKHFNDRLLYLMKVLENAE